MMKETITEAIMNLRAMVELPGSTSLEEVQMVIREFMRQHPEVFWFSHQYHYESSTSHLYFHYNFTPQKKEFYSREIEIAVENHFSPNKLQNLSELEKVAYVYKWIASNTTYNEYSSFNQTIYSVLINRNSVCTGYAKTAQYLLRLLGMESELVFGKFHSDNSEDGRHAWNVVKIDGKWYHVDFCMADLVLKHLLNPDEEPIEHDGMLWNYFCKPTDYVLRNRSIEFLEGSPVCIDSISQLFSIRLTKPNSRLAVCKSDSGTTAKVYLDSWDKESVVKIARRNQTQTDNEFNFLTQLAGCKHVVQLKGRCGSGVSLEQLTPWSELLNSHYYRINEQALTSILIQLAEGLIECRERGITYSDIHYNNIFVSKDGTYKWGDFGMAYPRSLEGFMPPEIIGKDGVPYGSRWFMAPETYNKHLFIESSAIYSLSILAYFVMNEMRPPLFSTTELEKEALDERLSGSKIELPKNSSSFPILSRIVGQFLDANLSSRPDSLEEFIRILDFHLSSSDEEVLVVDDTFALTDSFGIGDWDEHSDSFAATVGVALRNKRCDTDYFASSRSYEPIETNSPAESKDKKPPIEFKNSRQIIACEDTSGWGAMSYSPQSMNQKGGLKNIINKTISHLGGLFRKRRRSDANLLTEDSNGNQNKNSDIHACVYAPAEVRPNQSFIVRVYMYLPHEEDDIDAKIEKIDPTVVKKEYKPLDLSVKEGDKLTVRLRMSEEVECKDTEKSVIWHNHYTDCSFSAKLTDRNLVNIEGAAYILVNDLPAGEMLFTIDVVYLETRERYTNIESHRFSKIFISYSHQDEIQVRGIAEGCRMLGKDYFFDRHTLLAGDLFKEKILSYIDQADLFVLCWSKNAAESEWVKIERDYALQLICDNKSNLRIYPLSLQPEAPLPADMADKYNFGKL